MKPVHFTWDATKSSSNKKKHGVSFGEAETVFSDPNARLIADLRILVVCHCYRENDNQIRIISARKAKRKEIEAYEEHLQ